MTYPRWFHFHIPLGPDNIILVRGHGDPCPGAESRISRSKSPESGKKSTLLMQPALAGPMHSPAHLCQTSSPSRRRPTHALLSQMAPSPLALFYQLQLSPQSQPPLQDSLSPLLSFRWNRASLLSKAGSSTRTLNLNFSGLMESLVFTCEMRSQAGKMTSQTEYAHKAVYMVVHMQLI